MIKSCPCYVIISAIVLLIVLLLIYLFCCCRKCKNVLSERQQNIVLISGFTARGDLKGLKCALNSALNSGMKINEINEILIQMYAYAGFPRSLRAINTFIEVVDERKKDGKNDEAGEAAKILPANTDKNEYGNKVREKLFGMSNNKAGYAIFAPSIDDFLKEHLFADIFSRGILSYQDRELATVSALAALNNVEPMLMSHMKGAMNTGLKEDEIENALCLIQRNVLKTCCRKNFKLLKTITSSK